MCEMCSMMQTNASYRELLQRMTAEDKERLEFTKEMAKTLGFLNYACYTSIKWPITLVYPMFEPRMAYAVPSNYFQYISLDGNRIPNNFTHGSMRSIFFAKDKLMLFSKNTNFKDGKEFFTSFLLVHLEKNEYAFKLEGENCSISGEVTKPMVNLVTGKTENKTVAFNFVNTSVKGKLVTKDKVLQSAQFKSIYAKHLGGAAGKTKSIDLEGYAVTVPHFAPHPYLLLLKEQFGIMSNKEFQENVIEYFKSHKG